MPNPPAGGLPRSDCAGAATQPARSGGDAGYACVARGPAPMRESVPGAWRKPYVPPGEPDFSNQTEAFSVLISGGPFPDRESRREIRPGRHAGAGSVTIALKPPRRATIACRSATKRSGHLKITISGAFALLAVMTLALPAHAQANPQPSTGVREQRRMIWRERLAACANRSAGAVCSFSRQTRTIDGVCEPNRRGRLLCHADRRRGGRRMGGRWQGNAPGQ